MTLGLLSLEFRQARFGENRVDVELLTRSKRVINANFVYAFSKWLDRNVTYDLGCAVYPPCYRSRTKLNCGPLYINKYLKVENSKNVKYF